MVNLTDQLLAYARGGKYCPKNISLSKFVEETLPMILHKFDSVIHVETNLAGNILNITADITQMYMVLSAVVTNAAEAIEGRGRIIITTEIKDVEEGFAKYRPGLTPGRYVCLMVQDDGTGMDAETRDVGYLNPFSPQNFRVEGLAWLQCTALSKTMAVGFRLTPNLAKGPWSESIFRLSKSRRNKQKSHTPR